MAQQILHALDATQVALPREQSPQNASELRLSCLIQGESQAHIFSVHISPTQQVMDLRQAIYKEAFKKAEFPAKDLTLFKADIDPTAHTEDSLKEFKFTKDDEQLAPLLGVSFYWHSQPEPSRINVFVTTPSDRMTDSLARTHKRKREEGDEISTLDELDYETRLIQSWRLMRPTTHLPSVDQLSDVINQPIPDAVKIPVTQSQYNAFLSGITNDVCTATDLDTLFKVGSTSCPTTLWDVVSTLKKPPPTDVTEQAFIHFWDDNIRDILELLIPLGKCIRNSNKNMATANLRPDFGFLLRTVCPFRGEERGPEDRGDPKEELVDKLNWVYDPAPYVLGYYCVGSQMSLTAICRPVSQGSKPVLSDIVDVDLGLRSDRIANLRHLINLSGVIQDLSVLIKSPVDDFKTHKRDNCTVEITSALVVKTYTCQNAEYKVEQLKLIYTVLSQRTVPNTDMLINSIGPAVHLSPRGISVEPKSENELVQCLICILESLVVAHQVPIYHRDIQWPNVIRKLDDDMKWFLIDWEDAAWPPTKAKPRFFEGTHSPQIFVDGHGAEVDIWAIGHLITSCGAPNISQGMRVLGHTILQTSLSLSATDVLDSMKQYAQGS